MVHGVEQGFSLWMDPRWWPGPGSAVADEDLPVSAFDLAVVKAAKKYTVALVSPPAPVPAENVMGLAPGQRPVAARPRTAAVA